jgi:hypothetical protein
MQFPDLTKDDIAEGQGGSVLLAEGEAQFRVEEAEETHSSSGNPMMKLVLKVRDTSGKTAIVYDFLVYTENSKFKIVNFCLGAKLLDALDKKSLRPADAIGAKGNLIIKHEVYQGEKRNKVAKYIVDKDVAEKSKTIDFSGKAADPFDDEVPF